VDTLLEAARSEPGGMAGALLSGLSSEAGPQHLTFPDHTSPQKSFVTASSTAVGKERVAVTGVWEVRTWLQAVP